MSFDNGNPPEGGSPLRGRTDLPHIYFHDGWWRVSKMPHQIIAPRVHKAMRWHNAHRFVSELNNKRKGFKC